MSSLVQLIALTGVVCAASFVGTLYWLDGREDRPALALLGDLSTCRTAKRTDCARIAYALAKAILRGDNQFFESSEKSTFEVYLHRGRVVYVKANCTTEDVKVDLFALNFWPRDTSILSAEDRRINQDFASLNFHFREAGYRSGNYCLALAELPSTGVKKIYTGQFERPQGMVWHVTLLPKW